MFEGARLRFHFYESVRIPCVYGHHRELYLRRNEIERLFRRLKAYRRDFTRYDKLDLLHAGFLVLSLIVEGLRTSVNTL